MSDDGDYQDENKSDDSTDDSESEDDPSDAADDARDSFPDDEPDAVTPCHPEPPGGDKKNDTCTADQIKKNLDACDGGTDAWNKAKKAAGKDPVLTVGPTTSGFKAESDSSGAVTITPQDCCNAMQSMIHELTNVSHGPEFNKLDSDGASGDIAREDYMKGNEKLEYDGVKMTLKAFDACKGKWGCGPEAKAKFDGYRKAKDVDDYFDHYVTDDHKKFYRDFWDKHYKDAYDKKHPPPAPKK